MSVSYVGGSRRGAWVTKVRINDPRRVVWGGNFVEVRGRRRTIGVCW